jgi:hypothetical protein
VDRYIEQKDRKQKDGKAKIPKDGQTGRQTDGEGESLTEVQKDRQMVRHIACWQPKRKIL